MVRGGTVGLISSVGRASHFKAGRGFKSCMGHIFFCKIIIFISSQDMDRDFVMLGI